MSSTLSEPEGTNSTVLQAGDLVEAVHKLKQDADGDVRKRLFGDPGEKKTLRLVDRRSSGDGVAILVCQRGAQERRRRIAVLTTDSGSRTMRKIINSTYISLDGVIEGPHLPGRRSAAPATSAPGRSRPIWPLSCDALLMGRHTYDGFAPVWPTRSGDPISDHINAMREVRRLRDAERP